MFYNISDWIDAEQYYIDGFDVVDLSMSIEEHTELGRKVITM